MYIWAKLLIRRNCNLERRDAFPGCARPCSTGFPGSSVVKNPPAMQEPQGTQVRSLGWKDPLEEEMAPQSLILAWEIPWTEEPGRLWSVGSHRVGHGWATEHVFSALHHRWTDLHKCHLSGPFATGIQIRSVNGGTGWRLGSWRKEVRIFPLHFHFRQHLWPWLHLLRGCSSPRAASHWGNQAGRQSAGESGQCLCRSACRAWSRADQEKYEAWIREQTGPSTEGWLKTHQHPL